MQRKQHVANEGSVVELAPPSDATRGSLVDKATSDSSVPADGQNDQRAPWLTPHRWKPGQSGNPSGRPKESGSLAAALRRVGVKPAKARAELIQIAHQLGMDPDEAKSIDVVAGLIYDGITQLLIRTIKGQTGAGDKLVGLLQLLFKALDGDERRITLSGPGDLEAVLTNVSAVLGFRAGTPLPSPNDGNCDVDDEPSES
jgi:hypothetical protein